MPEHKSRAPIWIFRNDVQRYGILHFVHASSSKSRSNFPGLFSKAKSMAMLVCQLQGKLLRRKVLEMIPQSKRPATLPCHVVCLHGTSVEEYQCMCTCAC